MKLTTYLLGFVLMSSLLTGCADNRDIDNPSRVYLKSNTPITLPQLAQKLPTNNITSPVEIKIYSYNDEDTSLYKSVSYPANTTNAQEIVNSLPSQGHYKVSVTLDEQTLALDLDEGVITAN